MSQVTQLFSGYVNALLAEYARDPSVNWKAKDCAIYLVVALTVRGRTAAQGATTTNQLVNTGDFYNSQVSHYLCCSDMQISWRLAWSPLYSHLRSLTV